MSPAAVAFLTGAQSIIRVRLVLIPRTRDILTQEVFERTARALKVPLTSEKHK